MNKKFDVIRNLTFFDTWTDDDLIIYLRDNHLKIKSYGKNTVLHFEGEPCHHLEIILSGRVVVDSIDDYGNLLTDSEFNRDDILGGSLLFSKNPRYPMTVSTQHPTEILEIETQVLFNTFHENPEFLRTYLELISDHASILGNTIKHHVRTSIRESLLGFIQNECKKQSSKTIILPMTKKALAERIGVQRTSLSRELDKMRNEGLILFNRDTITLLI